MEKAPNKPFVYWAQSNDQLFLKIELEAKSTPTVVTSSKRFECSCLGVAPGFGEREFKVDLELHDHIVSGPSGYRMEVLGRFVQFYIEKDEDHFGYWPNLLKDRAKPAWLKIDFDRFQTGEVDSEEEREKERKKEEGDRMMKNTVDNLLRDVKLPNRQPPGQLDFKKMYLSAYNTFMLFGFATILGNILRSCYTDGADFIPKTYSRVGVNFCIIQAVQVLESVHSLTGLVRSSPIPALMQALGRCGILAMIHFQPQLQDSPLVFWLFVVWVCVEMIRYPFYIAQLHDAVPKALKVLRYTAWIVLYPAGMLCETLLMIRAIETYSYTHPSPLAEIGGLNITISRIIGAILCVYPFFCIFLLRYIFAQTKVQLLGRSNTKGGKSRKNL